MGIDDVWRARDLPRSGLVQRHAAQPRAASPDLSISSYAPPLVGCSGLLDSWPEWYIPGMTFSIEIEREDDGRWLAEIPTLAGVMCYGQDRDEAVARVQALALRVIAERLEHREAPSEFLNVTFQAA